MESASFLVFYPRTARLRGFTLIEMLVVLFIIALITTIVITGQSTYNKTLLLTDTAYGVALSAREAQTFGLASRKYGSVQNPGYGIHFSSATPGAYTLFADTAPGLAAPANCPLGTPGTPEAKPGNCRYDAADGVVSDYSFSRGFTVTQFCGKAGLTKYCSTDAAPLTTLDLVFTRPNTSTTISGLVNGSSLTSFSCAEITLADATKQATRTIRISSIGEISINQSCP